MIVALIVFVVYFVAMLLVCHYKYYKWKRRRL